MNLNSRRLAEHSLSSAEVDEITRSPTRPSRAEVEQALKTIIRWTGDDPDRAGLAETPARVARAMEEYFSGYKPGSRRHPAKDLRGDRRL